MVFKRGLATKRRQNQKYTTNRTSYRRALNTSTINPQQTRKKRTPKEKKSQIKSPCLAAILVAFLSPLQRQAASGQDLRILHSWIGVLLFTLLVFSYVTWEMKGETI